MFSVTTKKQYWSWLEAQITQPKEHTLKEIQDTYILSLLGKVKGKRILEVGGGNSRVAQLLGRNNEVWLVDGFEGKDGGPAKAPTLPGVKIVLGYMGQNLKEVPSNYFDYVFSISVVEHVPTDKYADCFRDISRVLAPGGRTIHAIDLYLFDDPEEGERAIGLKTRLDVYLNTPALAGGDLRWQNPPEITRDLTASAKFAFNSMATILVWNRIVPKLKEVRAVAVSCNAEMILEKSDGHAQA